MPLRISVNVPFDIPILTGCAVKVLPSSVHTLCSPWQSLILYPLAMSLFGVEPQFFMDEGFQYDGLTELIVTKDMSERKNEMIELGDAFIAFPGGTGTLEEISEIMSKVSLKQLDAPCILYNLNGFYQDLKALLNHMIEMGLSSKERQEGIYFVDSLDQIKCILGKAD